MSESKRCVLLLLLLRQAAGQRRARWRQMRETVTSRSESHTAAVRAGDASVAGGCPCSDSALCQPLPAPAVARREIFGFVGGDGSQVDLSRVTTVAWAEPDNYALLCRAHASGTRVILSAPRPEHVLTPNASARAEWVASTVAAVVASHHDGVVFDWEAPCPVDSSLQHWYAVLVAETRDALRRLHGGYQVSTCVAWSPDDVDGRGYDIHAFALASDLLYVMDYDTRSQARATGGGCALPCSLATTQRSSSHVALAAGPACATPPSLTQGSPTPHLSSDSPLPPGV